MRPNFRDSEGDGREGIRDIDKLLIQYEDEYDMNNVGNDDGSTKMISSLGDLSKAKSGMMRDEDAQ